MIVRTIEILLEYICFLISIYKFAKRKFGIDKWTIGLFLIEWIVMIFIIKGMVPPSFKLVIHMGFFVYIKIKFGMKWRNTISVYGLTLLSIMTLQMLLFYVFKILKLGVLDTEMKGCIINSIIIICLILWKEEYKNTIIKKLKSITNILFAVIFTILIFHVLYLYERSYNMNFDIAMQFLIESIGLSITAMLWVNAENENKIKTKELQMYDIYNHAFEEAISMIRMRQHEFENHINAIRCMQYMISERDELVIAQDEYCNSILKENKINKLLSLNLDPVVVGFLYSKISMANEKEVITKYDIENVDIKKKISICDFIEIVGILFDNAVEALELENEKILLLKILNEEGDFLVEISNISKVFLNNEIEKFCKYGYSTKGANRGVGLSRVKEIVHQYKASFHIQNCTYFGKNYLSFRVTFRK